MAPLFFQSPRSKQLSHHSLLSLTAPHRWQSGDGDMHGSAGGWGCVLPPASCRWPLEPLGFSSLGWHEKLSVRDRGLASGGPRWWWQWKSISTPSSHPPHSLRHSSHVTQTWSTSSQTNVGSEGQPWPWTRKCLKRSCISSEARTLFWHVVLSSRHILSKT